MTIKTFRGLIDTDEQQTITLHTNTGSTGYRIVNIAIMPHNPGTVANIEGVIKVYKVSQTTETSEVDFSDQTLLAAGYIQESISEIYGLSHHVVFEKEIFNQDIYITYKATEGTEKLNYYLELEQVKLDLSENTVATLKDIRNITSQ